jgi:hypothetical protein
LLLNLSDNYLKQSQNNTVLVQQKEMDRVGVEPTTSATAATFYLRAVRERKKTIVKAILIKKISKAAIKTRQEVCGRFWLVIVWQRRIKFPSMNCKIAEYLFITSFSLFNIWHLSLFGHLCPDFVLVFHLEQRIRTLSALYCLHVQDL